MTKSRVGVVGLGIMGSAMAANLLRAGPAPLFSATKAIYEAAITQGHGKSDTASVCAVLVRRVR